MKLRVSINALAEQELNETAAYYESKSVGLGVTFLEEIEHAIRVVIEHPESAPLIEGAVRRKLVRKFPYGVLYSLRPGEIRILAVMNQKRRPYYWRGRE
ncbi:MAG: type II toxin-antitoxin system RelE/ParE family toxin [Nitrospirae bacterium]|nr:type II toxin-antitoxin system RelE/ParE family toxin [Nitrospirota bacterium]